MLVTKGYTLCLIEYPYSLAKSTTLCPLYSDLTILVIPSLDSNFIGKFKVNSLKSLYSLIVFSSPIKLAILL